MHSLGRWSCWCNEESTRDAVGVADWSSAYADPAVPPVPTDPPPGAGGATPLGAPARAGLILHEQLPVPVAGATACRCVDLAVLVRDELAQRTGDRLPIGTDLPDKPVAAAGSRTQLSRVLGNLVDNAQRHATTTVRIALRSGPGDAVTREVCDDGPGCRTQTGSGSSNGSSGWTTPAIAMPEEPDWDWPSSVTSSSGMPGPSPSTSRTAAAPASPSPCLRPLRQTHRAERAEHPVIPNPRCWKERSSSARTRPAP